MCNLLDSPVQMLNTSTESGSAANQDILVSGQLGEIQNAPQNGDESKYKGL